jgi:hypothetical protein
MMRGAQMRRGKLMMPWSRMVPEKRMARERRSMVATWMALGKRRKSMMLGKGRKTNTPPASASA